MNSSGNDRSIDVPRDWRAYFFKPWRLPKLLVPMCVPPSLSVSVCCSAPTGRFIYPWFSFAFHSIINNIKVPFVYLENFEILNNLSYVSLIFLQSCITWHLCASFFPLTTCCFKSIGDLHGLLEASDGNQCYSFLEIVYPTPFIVTPSQVWVSIYNPNDTSSVSGYLVHHTPWYNDLLGHVILYLHKIKV